MKVCLRRLVFLFLGLTTAHAQVPSLVNYQGKLINGSNLVNGTVNIGFLLYTNSTGGSALFFETDANVPVVDGLYATMIGDNPSAGTLAAVLTNDAVYLEVQVNGTTLLPRERMASVSYALLAGGVTNGAIIGSMLSDGVITGAKLATNAVTGDKIADGSVSNADLAVSAVTSDKIAEGAIKSGDLEDAAAWKPTGNGGLTAGTHFIGTTDNIPVDIRSFNTRVLRLQYDASSPLITGGHPSNRVTVTGGTIGGGGNSINPNVVSGFYGTVAGGIGNRATGSRTAIGGGFANTNAGQDGVIGGGAHNQIGGSGAVIGGGEANLVNVGADFATIAGGATNQIGGASREAFIGGGLNNEIGTNSRASAIGGGYQNSIDVSCWESTIAGGYENKVGSNASYATVGGGQLNQADASSSTIAGGGQVDSLIQGNRTEGSGSFIGGGAGNQIGEGSYGAAIGGGEQNRILSNSPYGVIGGGRINNIGMDCRGACIGGGEGDKIYAGSSNSFIGGGYLNKISTNTPYSVIAGGYSNTVSGSHSFLGGGIYNTIHTSAEYAVIAGGEQNYIGTNARNATVGGGWGNRAIGVGSTIAGGGTQIGGWSYNTAIGDGSFIGGGMSHNTGIEATFGVIGGGYLNTVNAWCATIPGGSRNVATGTCSFAAGQRAKARHDGSFVWADYQDSDFATTTNNQFAIRASNGVWVASDLGSARALPEKGARFADNNIVAWGFFSAAGYKYNSFNIASITNTAEGAYFITLNPGPTSQAMAPIAMAEMEDVPSNAASARIVSINSSVSATSLYVYVCNGSYAPTNNDFTLIVTGR